MNKKKPKGPYLVAIHPKQTADGIPASIVVTAASPGAAARQAFRQLIAAKVLDRQPRTERGGTWEGVRIEPLPELEASHLRLADAA